MCIRDRYQRRVHGQSTWGIKLKKEEKMQPQPQLNLGGLPPPQGQYQAPYQGQPQPQLNMYDLPPPGQSAYPPPPPPQSYPSPMYAPPTAQAVPMVTPVMVPVLGKLPQAITCPFCNQTGPSVVRSEVGLGTWVACCGICCIAGGAPNLCLPGLGSLCGFLGLVPCCLDDCRDMTHLCSYCQNRVGQKKFLFS
eukprot:TRINITY_DN1688_c0_g2_i1.p1 TRINITY_DN1688_c0_g2~~TRINITY_DN1688_c0_g2_i1.p1  ORF type:complete len:193 (+),score=68.16 TRINITY_DN1688_c0_g2_i1:101-679(+)